MNKSLLLTFMLPFAFADESLNTDTITSQQLITAQPQNTHTPVPTGNGYITPPATNTINNTTSTKLNSDKSLLNPDGTLGVSDNTKMQVNPDGVSFKMGY